MYYIYFMDKPIKMGRPKLPKTRSDIYPIRLLPEEREKYEGKAAKASLSLAEWIRNALRNASK